MSTTKDITGWTSIATNCFAERAFEPSDIGTALDLFARLEDNNESPVVVGNGTNTLICTERITRPVISLKRIRGEISVFNDVNLEVGAATPMPAIAKRAYKLGLSGAEFMVGVPGLIGGGVLSNAGRGLKGTWLSDVVTHVQLWCNGSLAWVNASELNFRYREGEVPPGSMVSKVRLRLAHGRPKEIRDIQLSILKTKQATQPVNENTFGSTFFTRDHGPAALHIERLGLKGKSVGGAKLSNLHCNFIENEYGGRWQDVIKLMEMAETACAVEGVALVREVRTINE